MSDLISRQAAVEAIEKTDWYHINKNGELVSGANSQEHEPLYKASEIYAALEEVPSTQPEIIRCKKCLMHGVCRFEQGLGLDGYCSKAERRTDDNSNLDNSNL